METTVKELLGKAESILPEIVAGAAIAAFAELAIDIDLFADSALANVFLFYAYGLVGSLLEPVRNIESEQWMHRKLEMESKDGIRIGRRRKQLKALRFCGEVLNILFVISALNILHLVFCTKELADGWWHCPVFAIVSIVVLRIAAKISGVNCMFAFERDIAQMDNHGSGSPRPNGGRE